jgi:flagellar L-ring protein precursor FlgH
VNTRRLNPRTAAQAAVLASLLALAGCDVLFPRVQVADTAPIPQASVATPPPANGSIYQAATYRPLFEDHRARHIGDTLVVQIVEKVSASQKSTSSIDKSGTLSAGITALPGVKPAAFARAGADANSANTFAGKGATESSNDFSGTITVIVRGVLPNGHLLIAGEKQIGVNTNVDVLRFSGQVDPRPSRPATGAQRTGCHRVRRTPQPRPAGRCPGDGPARSLLPNVLPI